MSTIKNKRDFIFSIFIIAFACFFFGLHCSLWSTQIDEHVFSSYPQPSFLLIDIMFYSYSLFFFVGCIYLFGSLIWYNPEAPQESFKSALLHFVSSKKNMSLLLCNISISVFCYYLHASVIQTWSSPVVGPLLIPCVIIFLAHCRVFYTSLYYCFEFYAGLFFSDEPFIFRTKLSRIAAFLTCILGVLVLSINLYKLSVL